MHLCKQCKEAEQQAEIKAQPKPINQAQFKFWENSLREVQEEKLRNQKEISYLAGKIDMWETKF